VPQIHRHYVCAVLPPEPEVLDAAGNTIKEALPQRAKVHDFRPRVSHAADIPVDTATGLTLRDWCVVAVNADPPIHAQLAADPDIWPIGGKADEKRNVRSFLQGRGEDTPPDTPQGCLTRCHPMSDHGHVPKIEDLRAG